MTSLYTPVSKKVHGNGMVGWTFQLLVPFSVTQVGWYDKGADGLSRAFQVGLWQGEGRDGEPPRFPGSQYFSFIGDPESGLIIPSGTNASLAGVWRVVDLPEPFTLQPGFYELGGLDTSTTTRVQGQWSPAVIPCHNARFNTVQQAACSGCREHASIQSRASPPRHH